MLALVEAAEGASTRPGHVRVPALLHRVGRGLESGGWTVGKKSGAWGGAAPVSYTHLRAHETRRHL
eukprot:6987419-Prorocentrum_lima.AAC.1